MARRKLCAPTHEGANRGGRGLVNVHAIFVDDGPEAIAIRIVRGALIHHGCGAVRERAIDYIRVARDPPNVRGAPVDVGLLDVEDVMMRRSRTKEIACGGMHDALGLAGGSAGIEEKEHILGIHRFRHALIRRCANQVMPPVVAAGCIVAFAASPTRRTTTTFSMLGVSRSASSTAALSATTVPRR